MIHGYEQLAVTEAMKTRHLRMALYSHVSQGQTEETNESVFLIKTVLRRRHQRFGPRPNTCYFDRNRWN